MRLPQPLLLEGEAGVGKTEAAKALALVLDTPLIRLQCYEGIDAAEALYEWNYPRQLLGIRLAEATGREVTEHDLFGPDYLVERPLLQAIRHPGPRPVESTFERLHINETSDEGAGVLPIPPVPWVRGPRRRPGPSTYTSTLRKPSRSASG